MATKWRTNRVMGSEYVKAPLEDCSAEKYGDATIQKDALTPLEILERYSAGLDVSRLKKFGIYDTKDTTLNDLVLSSKFRDLTQVDDLIRKSDELNEKIAKAKEVWQAIQDKDLNKDGIITDGEIPAPPEPDPEP